MTAASAQVGRRCPAEPDDTGVDDLPDPGREGSASPMSAGAAQPPDPSSRSAPTSSRWRVTSLTKNGLPSVSSWTARARATPWSSIGRPAMAAMTETTSVGSNPGRSIRPTPSRRRSAPRVSTSWSDVRHLAVPERAHHGEPHGPVVGRQVPQQLHAAVVGPLEVVEDQDHGPVAGEGRQQSHHGGEELEPLGVGVDGPDRGQARQPAAERGDERAELGTPLVDQVPQLALGSVPHVVPERLGEQLVRGAQVLLAVARQDERPVVERPAGHFGHDRALPCPASPDTSSTARPEAGVGALHGRGQRLDLAPCGR